MGKWICKCGQYMNDHNCPNENGYLVFSEYEWDEISSQTDDDRISWYDIPAPTFDVYKCPSCGRLMVFGESNRCLYYKPEFELEDAKEILTKSVNILFEGEPGYPVDHTEEDPMPRTKAE